MKQEIYNYVTTYMYVYGMYIMKVLTVSFFKITWEENFLYF